MIEPIEQAMRTLKLGGLAKEWRSVAYENTEQYVSERPSKKLCKPPKQCRIETLQWRF